MILIKGAKRMPKWKFRLADGVVVQIQAMLGCDDGVQMNSRHNDDARATDAVAKRLDEGWILDFRVLFAEAGWSLRPRRIGNRSGLDHDEAFKIKQRIVDLLPLLPAEEGEDWHEISLQFTATLRRTLSPHPSLNRMREA